MVTSEKYKGIEFVRVSNMSEEQRQLIFQTLDRSKIIKIQRDNELLNDCIQLSDFTAWMNGKSAAATPTPKPSAEAVQLEDLKLAFK